MIKNSKGIGGHQSANAKTVEYYTPPEIIQSLGEFDLDPCYPMVPLPWQTAKKVYTKADNGLLLPWEGRVWLNPPYGKELAVWVKKLSMHNNGILLAFNRSETDAFHQFIYPVATSQFIMRGRLHFYKHIYDKQYASGIRATIQTKSNSGGPTVLFAYGEENSEYMDKCGLPGVHLPINSVPVFIVTVSQPIPGANDSWRSVISIALTRLNGRAEVNAIYKEVELIASDKVNGNSHYKEKIRQKLQEYFIRVDRGVYSKN